MQAQDAPLYLQSQNLILQIMSLFLGFLFKLFQFVVVFTSGLFASRES